MSRAVRPLGGQGPYARRRPAAVAPGTRRAGERRYDRRRVARWQRPTIDKLRFGQCRSLRCAQPSPADRPDTTTEICDGGVGETLRLVPGDPAIGRLLVALPREKHLLGKHKFIASAATQRCLFQYQMSARRAQFTSQRLNLIYIGIALLRCDFQPAISVLGNQPAIVLKSPHRQPCLPLRCFRCRPS